MSNTKQQIKNILDELTNSLVDIRTQLYVPDHKIAEVVEAIDRLVAEARIAELEVVKSQITEAHMILSPCGYRHTIDNILHPEIIEDRIAELQSQLNKEQK